MEDVPDCFLDTLFDWDGEAYTPTADQQPPQQKHEQPPLHNTGLATAGRPLTYRHMWYANCNAIANNQPVSPQDVSHQPVSPHIFDINCFQPWTVPELPQQQANVFSPMEGSLEPMHAPGAFPGSALCSAPVALQTEAVFNAIAEQQEGSREQVLGAPDAACGQRQGFKRKSNSAAQRRYRVKQKQKNQGLEQTLQDLGSKIVELECVKRACSSLQAQVERLSLASAVADAEVRAHPNTPQPGSSNPPTQSPCAVPPEHATDKAVRDLKTSNGTDVPQNRAYCAALFHQDVEKAREFLAKYPTSQVTWGQLSPDEAATALRLSRSCSASCMQLWSAAVHYDVVAEISSTLAQHAQQAQSQHDAQTQSSHASTSQRAVPSDVLHMKSEQLPSEPTPTQLSDTDTTTTTLMQAAEAAAMLPQSPSTADQTVDAAIEEFLAGELQHYPPEELDVPMDELILEFGGGSEEGSEGEDVLSYTSIPCPHALATLPGTNKPLQPPTIDTPLAHQPIHVVAAPVATALEDPAAPVATKPPSPRSLGASETTAELHSSQQLLDWEAVESFREGPNHQRLLTLARSLNLTSAAQQKTRKLHRAHIARMQTIMDDRMNIKLEAVKALLPPPLGASYMTEGSNDQRHVAEVHLHPHMCQSTHCVLRALEASFMHERRAQQEVVHLMSTQVLDAVQWCTVAANLYPLHCDLEPFLQVIAELPEERSILKVQRLAV